MKRESWALHEASFTCRIEVQAQTTHSAPHEIHPLGRVMGHALLPHQSCVRAEALLLWVPGPRQELCAALDGLGPPAKEHSMKDTACFQELNGWMDR